MNPEIVSPEDAFVICEFIRRKSKDRDARMTGRELAVIRDNLGKVISSECSRSHLKIENLPPMSFRVRDIHLSAMEDVPHLVFYLSDRDCASWEAVQEPKGVSWDIRNSLAYAFNVDVMLKRVP